MKKLAGLSIFIVFLGATVAFAAKPFGAGCDGHGGGRGGGSGMPLALMDNVLDLTDEQRVSLNELYAQHRQERRESNGGKGGNGRRAHQGLWAIDSQDGNYQQHVATLADQAANQARERILLRADLHEQVQALLTPDQREQLRAFHQEMMEEKRARRAQ